MIATSQFDVHVKKVGTGRLPASCCRRRSGRSLSLALGRAEPPRSEFLTFVSFAISLTHNRFEAADLQVCPALRVSSNRTGNALMTATVTARQRTAGGSVLHCRSTPQCEDIAESLGCAYYYASDVDHAARLAISSWTEG